MIKKTLKDIDEVFKLIKENKEDLKNS